MITPIPMKGFGTLEQRAYLLLKVRSDRRERTVRTLPVLADFPFDAVA